MSNQRKRYTMKNPQKGELVFVWITLGINIVEYIFNISSNDSKRIKGEKTHITYTA